MVVFMAIPLRCANQTAKLPDLDASRIADLDGCQVARLEVPIDGCAAATGNGASVINADQHAVGRTVELLNRSGYGLLLHGVKLLRLALETESYALLSCATRLISVGQVSNFVFLPRMLYKSLCFTPPAIFLSACSLL